MRSSESFAAPLPWDDSGIIVQHAKPDHDKNEGAPR